MFFKFEGTENVFLIKLLECSQRESFSSLASLDDRYPLLSTSKKVLSDKSLRSPWLFFFHNLSVKKVSIMSCSWEGTGKTLGYSSDFDVIYEVSCLIIFFLIFASNLIMMSIAPLSTESILAISLMKNVQSVPIPISWLSYF